MFKSISRVWLISILFIALNIGFVPNAFAQKLDELRASGQVGEGYDGYARARASSVEALVKDVNAKRRAIYSERAKQQGVTADQVGIVYAQKIIAKCPSGTWLLMKDGSWKQK